MGRATGTGSLGGGLGGDGLFVLDGTSNSLVNIYGGSFTGGDGTQVPGGSSGVGGNGLMLLTGNTNIYGGRFTGGMNGGIGIDVSGSDTTLYGSDFFVNGDRGIERSS